MLQWSQLEIKTSHLPIFVHAAFVLAAVNISAFYLGDEH